MWGGDSESGLSVLARASARPAVAALQPSLLPGLAPGDAVQVSGDAGSGCSLVLYELVARALLPPDLRGVDLGGSGAQVLFLDTDLHFCVLQLSVVAEGIAKKALRKAKRELKTALDVEKMSKCGDTSEVRATCMDEKDACEKVSDVEGNNKEVESCTSAQAREINVGMGSGAINCAYSKNMNLDSESSGIVHSENKSNNQEISTEASGSLNAAFSAKYNRNLDSCPSHVSGSHSIDLPSLQWLLKTPLAKLRRMVKDVVASCLANFVYLRCSYSAQFVTTLLSLDSLLAAHPRVSLICVDSLSNFYWHDRSFTCETWRTTEQYYNKIMKSVLDCTSKNKVVFVGVQQTLFAKQKRQQGKLTTREYEHYDFLGQTWASKVRYKIRIRRARTGKRYEFLVSERGGTERTRCAVYRPEGITWIQNE